MVSSRNGVNLNNVEKEKVSLNIGTYLSSRTRSGRWPVWAAALLQLALWNKFIAGSCGGLPMTTCVVLHLGVSALALVLLWALTRWLRRGRGLAASFLACVAMALVPPVATIWLLYAGPQLISLQIDGLGQIFMVALWVALSAWPYWFGAGVGLDQPNCSLPPTTASCAPGDPSLQIWRCQPLVPVAAMPVHPAL